MLSFEGSSFGSLPCAPVVSFTRCLVAWIGKASQREHGESEMSPERHDVGALAQYWANVGSRMPKMSNNLRKRATAPSTSIASGHTCAGRGRLSLAFFIDWPTVRQQNAAPMPTFRRRGATRAARDPIACVRFDETVSTTAVIPDGTLSVPSPLLTRSVASRMPRRFQLGQVWTHLIRAVSNDRKAELSTWIRPSDTA